MAISPLEIRERPRPQVVRGLLRIDPLLLLAAVGLSLCSFVALRPLSGKLYGGEAHRQLLYAGIGLALALALSRFDYTHLRELRYWVYGAAIVLNLAAFAFSSGASAGDVHRRIPLPAFSFQPSEFGKLLLILALAAIATERTRRMSDHRTTARIMLFGLIPALIVFGQSDLGDALVYVTIAVAILFFVGVSWKHLAGLAALAVIAGVLVLAVEPALHVNLVHLSLTEQQRLSTFINPPAVCNATKDPYCYQLHQALIATGSGGKTGVGAAGATQVSGGFIPEASSDFIFATFSEMFGFVGGATVLLLYALIIWRALRIVTLAKNLYGTLIAGGVLAMLMFEIFLNVGMELGIMPVTGVALPLLSYGGSSVVATFLAVGLLESVYVQARATSAEKARALVV